jgi:SAM-dependent methyltransferase
LHEYPAPRAYDVLHFPGTATEVDVLQRIAARWVASKSPAWLEPACGTGRYLRIAARRGIACFGFDRDPAMIAYARRHDRRSQYFIADMTDFANAFGRRRADFAFNLHNTIRHLRNDAALLAHLAGMARVLRRGGAYAIGISLTRYGAESPDEDLWEGRRGLMRVVQLVQYLPPVQRGRFEHVVSHTRIEHGDRVTAHDSTYDLRCYSLAQWRRLIARSPFRIAATVSAGGEPRARGIVPYGIDILKRARS